MDVCIRLTGGFQVEVDGAPRESVLGRSRKGVGLLKLLILQRGKPASSRRLMRALDPEGHCENPESAMKTLVSRTRALLNAIAPGLGASIASEAGAYRWQTLEGVQVDVLEILQILEQLRQRPIDEERSRLTERLLELYRGELEEEYWLHREYLEAVYAWIGALREREAYNRICDICRRVLAIEPTDEQTHIFLMEALLNLDRSDEAMEEYRRVARQSREYYDAEPSDALQDCYQTLLEESQSVKFNLDVIHNELAREDENMRGPFFCEYRAFKEIYNIQVRNLDRLGSTMFLAVIMLSGRTAASREGGMAALTEILRSNLRRGDIVTRFSENIVAMLLPTVNYATGTAVMERIEHLFYREYPGAIAFHYRVSPLGGMHIGEQPR